MSFSSEQVSVGLAGVARCATRGLTFAERMRAITDELTRLVPCATVSAVVADVRARTIPAAELMFVWNGHLESLRTYVQEYSQVDPMLPAGLETLARPILLSDVAPGRRFGRDRYTGEFLSRLGIRHVMGCAHCMPDGSTLLFALHDDGLRGYLDRWTSVCCDVADAVVTVSEHSKSEIAALYGRPLGQIDVIPNAVDESFFKIPRTRHAPPFLLYVGAIEEKKNVTALVRAFGELVRAEPDLPHHLVLAGSGGGKKLDLERALALAPRDRVNVLGHVPDDHLRALYGAADAFVYLSRYEGFGLPPVEAMAAGVPTVVANASCLPEVTGGGALLVDPDDTPAVVRTLSRVLRDEALRADLVERGRAAARRFSWEASARSLVSLFERVLQKRKAGRGAA